MQGGTIEVHGDAGDWVGAELAGGIIHVYGRAGHLVGAAYRGSARGMTGGTIVVDAEAGNEIGQNTLGSGLIGQYQKNANGEIVLEIVYPFDVASADMIYPFPKF